MTTNGSLLRALVDLRDRQIQKGRIQFGNRLDALQRQADESAGSGQRTIVERWNERFAEMEKELDKDIRRVVRDEPMHELLSGIKGVGDTFAAKLLAFIDIERAGTVSAVWRYAGYAVIDGERERAKKGEVLHYNKRLKTTCYLIAESFLRCNSPYRAIYDEAKAYYQAERSDWTLGHCHNAAMRKMVKIFLSHLWLRWRELEGLPTSRPYVHAHLEHTHVYEPADFGWPEVEAVVNE